MSDQIVTAEQGSEVYVLAYGWWRHGRVVRVKRGGRTLVVAFRTKDGAVRRTTVRADEPSLQPPCFVAEEITARALPAYCDRPFTDTPAPMLAECVS